MSLSISARLDSAVRLAAQRLLLWYPPLAFITLLHVVLFSAICILAIMICKRVRSWYLHSPPNASLWLPYAAAAFFKLSPISCLQYFHKRLGNVFTIDVMVSKMTFVLGPHGDEFVYTANDNDMSLETAIADLGENVLGKGFLDDKEWNPIVPHTLAKGFMRTEMLEGYQPLIAETCLSLITEWQQQSSLDIYRATSRVVNLCNVRCLLGEHAFQTIGREMADEFYELELCAFSPLAMLAPKLPIPRLQRMHMLQRKLMGFCVAEADRLRADPTLLEGRQDFMALVVRTHGDKYPSINYARIVLGTMLGAHANTLGSLAWTIAHIAADDTLLARVRADIAARYNTTGPVPANAIQYAQPEIGSIMDSCLKETIRKYGLPFVFRTAHHDVEYEGFTIPEGALICCSPMWAHYNEEVFPEPHRYIADRFTDAELVQRLVASKAYAQFGFGRHRCLGRIYAPMMGRTLWTLLFSHCDVRLSGPLPAPDYTKFIGMPTPTVPLTARIVPRTAAAVVEAPVEVIPSSSEPFGVSLVARVLCHAFFYFFQFVESWGAVPVSSSFVASSTSACVDQMDWEKRCTHTMAQVEAAVSRARALSFST